MNTWKTSRGLLVILVCLVFIPAYIFQWKYTLYFAVLLIIQQCVNNRCVINKMGECVFPLKCMDWNEMSTTDYAMNIWYFNLLRNLKWDNSLGPHLSCITQVGSWGLDFISHLWTPFTTPLISMQVFLACTGIRQDVLGVPLRKLLCAQR